MKILILSSWYPDDENNANGVFVKEQAKALAENGIEIRVLYPFDKSKSTSKMMRSEEDGIITYRCNTDYIKNSKLSRLISTIKTIKELKKISKEFNFELIHCHVCYFAGIIGYFYKKLYGMKYIITEHMSYIESYARKKYNYILLKRAYNSAEAVICVSNYLADNLVNLGFTFKKQIIGNVVDTSIFDIRENGKTDDKPTHILFIGSMGNDEVKGVNYLLKAFSLLAKTKDNVSLHLIGDGVKRTEYESMATSLEIDRHCKFYGRMDKGDVAKMLQSSSFFVLPSRYETFGTVIIEALSCGKPVVTTDRGGQKEIINSDNLGRIVRCEDVESLYEGLKYMSDNYKTYDSRYLREYAMKYSYKSIANKLYELYKILK